MFLKLASVGYALFGKERGVTMLYLWDYVEAVDGLLIFYDSEGRVLDTVVYKPANECTENTENTLAA